MSDRLIPCSGCARHVKESAARCPFCGAGIIAGPRPAPPRPALRRNRGAVLALGASLAAAGCNRGGLPGPTLPDASIIRDLSVPDLSAPRDLTSPPEPDLPPFDTDADVALYGSPPPPRDLGK